MTTQQEQEKAIAVGQRERPLRPAWPMDLDRFLERAMRGLDFGPWRGLGRIRPISARREEWLPEMDVFEKDGKIVLRADLPGMKREDIDVALEGDLLTVRGRRQEEQEIKEEDYYCAERSVGSFYRSLRLPEGVNADDIQATYQDGVLEVSVPKPPAPEPHKLQVAVK